MCKTTSAICGNQTANAFRVVQTKHITPCCNTRHHSSTSSTDSGDAYTFEIHPNSCIGPQSLNRRWILFLPSSKWKMSGQIVGQDEVGLECSLTGWIASIAIRARSFLATILVLGGDAGSIKGVGCTEGGYKCAFCFLLCFDGKKVALVQLL